MISHHYNSFNLNLSKIILLGILKTILVFRFIIRILLQNLFNYYKYIFHIHHQKSTLIMKNPNLLELYKIVQIYHIKLKSIFLLNLYIMKMIYLLVFLFIFHFIHLIMSNLIFHSDLLFVLKISQRSILKSLEMIFEFLNS